MTGIVPFPDQQAQRFEILVTLAAPLLLVGDWPSHLLTGLSTTAPVL